MGASCGGTRVGFRVGHGSHRYVGGGMLLLFSLPTLLAFARLDEAFLARAGEVGYLPTLEATVHTVTLPRASGASCVLSLAVVRSLAHVGR